MNRPTNPLEEDLLAVQQGALDEGSFIKRLLTQQLFMPIRDEARGNIQISKRAEPLTLTNEEGIETLILFTSPERAKSFVADFPGFAGGLLAETPWILARIGSGIAIAINPGYEIGLDLEPAIVAVLQAEAAALESAGLNP
jgi:hypothetical protein